MFLWELKDPKSWPYEQQTGAYLGGDTRTTTDYLSQEIVDAFTIRAKIDLVGFCRRGIEKMYNPEAAGLKLKLETFPKMLCISQELLESADALLRKLETNYRNKPSWIKKNDRGETVFDSLCGSLGHERRALAKEIVIVIETGWLQPGGDTYPPLSKLYRDCIQDAIRAQGKGQIETAATAYLQGAELARHCNEIGGAEVITFYDKGVDLLMQLPDKSPDGSDHPTKNGWRQNVRDHIPDLLARYPDQTSRIEALRDIVSPPTPPAIPAPGM